PRTLWSSPPLTTNAPPAWRAPAMFASPIGHVLTFTLAENGTSTPGFLLKADTSGKATNTSESSASPSVHAGCANVQRSAETSILAVWRSATEVRTTAAEGEAAGDAMVSAGAARLTDMRT